MTSSASSMAVPSRIKERIRLPLLIPIHPYLKDHHFEGKIILPAVEMLQRLARSVQSYLPDAHIRCMRFASFDRFLNIGENSPVIEAFNELEVYESGRLCSKLITVSPIRGTTAIRTKVHTVVNFTTAGERIAGLPIDMLSALDGICYKIPSRKLYSDMVPFGPSYQNVKGNVFLSESGGVAQVYGAEHPAPRDPLGSPFPFDGALHVACAWGQRFHHIVAFPVGFEERLIVNQTVPGETYFCRILPVSVTGESLKFDIWIHDSAGCLREEIRGLIMRDVSGGRVGPPPWVRSEGAIPLAVIGEHCRAVSVIDIDTIADFAVKALSEGESERFKRMEAKRQKSYLAARLTLKYLSRKLAGGDRVTPASDIHTMMEDRIHPRCPIPGSKGTAFCSVSHDSRFAIAVAADDEIGIDVERVSDRVLKERLYYMEKEEIALTETSPLGVVHASTRVWSIKEGIAKATDRPLAESWKRVKVNDIGQNRSCLTVEGTRYVAFHDTVDDHIFTMVKRDS